MPYKRRGKYIKRRTYKRRSSRPGYKNCGKMVASDASSLWSAVSGLRSLLNVEYKHYDGSFNTTPLNSGTVVQLGPLLPQDATADGRNGRKVKISSLSMKMSLELNAAVTNTRLRITLLRDNQTDGATAVYTDFFESGNVFAQVDLNQSSRKKFTMIKTWLISLSAGGKSERLLTFYRKLNTHITYMLGTTTGLAGTIEKGNYWFFVTSDETVSGPVINCHYRFRYIDN